MKHLSLLIPFALLLLGCESTDLNQSGKPNPGKAGKGTSIVQGMATSQVVALIGQPESIERNVDMGNLKMDRWHYEIELGRISRYQEIEPDPETDVDGFGEYAYDDPMRPVQMSDLLPKETVLAESIRTHILDIFVYQDKVFGMKSKIEEDYFEEDYRDKR